MSTHNICFFCVEIRKISEFFIEKSALPGAMIKYAGRMVNSADPDQTLHSAISDLAPRL